MAHIGYDHRDGGEEAFYIKYPVKRYPIFISKLTKQEVINEPLIINFEHTKSLYSLKYSINFENFFNYRINPKSSDNILQILNFDLKLMQKNKMIKLVNFDIMPVVALSVNNLSSTFPFDVNFKFGKYQASRVQHFDSHSEFGTYDFSKVLKSMLPFYRSGLSVGHSNRFSATIFNKDIDITTKYKIALNRIHDYEDNIKLSTNLRTNFDIYEEFKKVFKLKVTNDLGVKKAFIRNSQKMKKNNDAVSKEYKEHHVLSGYDCHSKILGMNILNTDNKVENGSDFYIQNLTTIRLTDIPGLKESEVLSKLNPFFSLESIFLPAYRPNSKGKYEFDVKNSFRFIWTFGLSIAITENIFIELGFYHNASQNTKIKKEHLTRFRINLST